MKVIDGGFGAKTEAQDLGAALVEALEMAELNTLEGPGNFLLLIEHEGQLRFCSNFVEISDACFCMDKGKYVMTNLYMKGEPL